MMGGAQLTTICSPWCFLQIFNRLSFFVNVSVATQTVNLEVDLLLDEGERCKCPSQNVNDSKQRKMKMMIKLLTRTIGAVLLVSVQWLTRNLRDF